jgi:hypothetical protein
MNKRVVMGMVGMAVCARLLPHPWNFTPMMALGLYLGVQSRRVWTGLLAVLATYVLSDLVLGVGLYRGLLFVYAAAMLPVLIGRVVRRREGALAICAGAVCGSVAFFLVSNFGVWASFNLYPRTMAGLGACFAAGIPFYQNQLLGDAFFTVALFGGHALLSRLLQPAPRTA